MTGQPAVPGAVKIALLRRLGADWRALADLLDVPADRQRQFDNKEDPGRAVWEWLEDRDGLDRLPEALRLIDRADLAELLTGDDAGWRHATMDLSTAVREPTGELDADATVDVQRPAPRRSPWLATLVTVIRASQRNGNNAVSTAMEPSVVPRPDEMIERPDLADDVVAALTSKGRQVVLISGLYGAGGFGKTTLAQQVYHSPKVLKSFENNRYWVTVGASPTAGHLTAVINELCQQISPEAEVLDERALPSAAARVLGRLLAARERVLLVIDDVWDTDDLDYFTHGGGQGCVRLVTTRKPDVLIDPGVKKGSIAIVKVDEFTENQTRQLLIKECPEIDQASLADLVRLTGRWPLLVGLVRHHLRKKRSPKSLVSQLSDGPTRLDLTLAKDRKKAVERCIQASVEPLPADAQMLLASLAIFAEDIWIPRSVLAVWWGYRARWSSGVVEKALRSLDEMSLLDHYDVDTGKIRLHDVIRRYLRETVTRDTRQAVGLAAMSETFVEAARALVPNATGGSTPDTSWWLLADAAGDTVQPEVVEYLLRYLCQHLTDAGRETERTSLAKDLRWVEAKLRHLQRAPVAAVIDDLSADDGSDSLALRDALARSAHLLAPIEPADCLGDVLISRLESYSALTPVVADYRNARSARPRLTSIGPLPDRPHPTLAMVLSEGVNNLVCALDAAGTIALSGGDDDDQSRPAGDHQATVRHIRRDRPARSLTGHAAPITACAVSPDGRLGATADDQGEVRLWNLDTATAWSVHRGHSGRVQHIVVASDNQTVVTAGWDHTALVWRAGNEPSRAVVLRGHTYSVEAVAVDAVAGTVLTASSDRTARVWDTRKGRTRHVLTGHTQPVVGCSLDRAGSWAVTASLDRTARVWDAKTGALLHILEGHTGAVTSCVMDDVGNIVVTGSTDHTARVWDAKTGALLHTLAGHSGPVLSSALSTDGRRLLTAGADRCLRVWHPNVASQADRDEAGSRNATSFATDRDGRISVTVSSASGAQISRHWDERLLRDLDGPGGAQTCAVNAAGTAAVIAYEDGTTRIWDAGTGVLHKTLPAIGGVNECAASNESEEFLVVTALHPRVGQPVRTLIWDGRTGELRTAVDHGEPVTVTQKNIGSHCAIDDGGTTVATAGLDHVVRLWDARSGAPRRVLDEHAGKVRSCALSSDGQRLISAGDDHTARIWDTATGACLQTLAGHTAAVTSCAFHTDGNIAATASADQTIRVWDCHTGTCTATIRVDSALREVHWLSLYDTVVAVGTGGLLYEFLYTRNAEE